MRSLTIIYPDDLKIEEIKAGNTLQPSFLDKKIVDVVTDMPKISLVVPVLQEEKLLEKTLSAYSPDLRKKYSVELIVSDGGSKDKTVTIAEKFADKIVKHECERRQTIAEGRNKGADVAKGDILVFINGDTVPENPDEFFKFIHDWNNGSIKYKHSSALACKVSVAPDEKILKDTIFYSIHNCYVRFLNFIGLGMGRGECQIIKTEQFRSVGGYNPLIIAGEDFDLYRRLAKISKVSFVSEIKVFESPRRFRKYGYMRIVFSWIINSLSVMIFGRSVSSEWEAVR